MGVRSKLLGWVGARGWQRRPAEKRQNDKGESPCRNCRQAAEGSEEPRSAGRRRGYTKKGWRGGGDDVDGRAGEKVEAGGLMLSGDRTRPRSMHKHTSAALNATKVDDCQQSPPKDMSSTSMGRRPCRGGALGSAEGRDKKLARRFEHSPAMAEPISYPRKTAPALAYKADAPRSLALRVSGPRQTESTAATALTVCRRSRQVAACLAARLEQLPGARTTRSTQRNN